MTAAPADATQDLLQKIRRNKIDVNAVYRVRELSLTREDVRFYFSEGMLALLEPIAVPGKPGLVTGAIFVGEGETLVMPPDNSEKRNLAHFVGTPVLNEKFTAAFLRFGDDTSAQLAAGIKEHTVKGGLTAAEFIEEWGPVVQNLDLLYDLRLLNDFLTPENAAHPFFAAHLFGQKIGAFDISVDPLATEQVSVAQVNWKDGRRCTDLWLSFLSASARKTKAADSLDPILLRNYRIDAAIDTERQLDVKASVDFDAILSGARMITFQLSRFLKVSSAELAGASAGTPLTVYQTEGESEQRSNDVITILMPAPLERGKHYTISFRYSGGVIADAGHGVLYVGARGNWYPQRGYRAALYDLTFRFPRKLSLVATGERLEQREEGEIRISHWKSKDPIRVAGFNIGEYEEAHAKTTDGATVTVYANRELETDLQRRTAPAPIEPLTTVPNPNRRGMQNALPLPPAPTPQPTDMAAKMARDLAQVVDYFAHNFGPLPFAQLNVSPIPGTFGQGWPGLIYLSTSAYLSPNDFTAKSSNAELFYRPLLPVHEVAHQWWGHVVIPATYRDEWIMEALASYSAMMWMEQKDHGNPRYVHQALGLYRQNLLQKQSSGDEVVDSIGPLSLGYRLNNSHTPSGSSPIFYNKGPWVIHMLRQLMRDPKLAPGAPGSDATFFKFLRALRDEYSARPLSTAAFRELAEKYISPQLNAESANKGRSLEWFFDQWVAGTGIPELRIEAKLEAPRAPAATAAAKARPAGRVKIAGTATLENVEETWIIPVPLFLQTPRGEVFAGVAVASAGASATAGGNPDDAKFSLSLPGPASKVLIDPQQSLLVVRK